MLPSTHTPIFGIPLEIIEHALTFCHPFDVVSFSFTCHFAYDLVYRNNDSHIWRQLFLLYPFDDPRKSLKAMDDPEFIAKFDWQGHLRRRIKAEAIASSTRENALAWACALDTFITLAQEAAPLSMGNELGPSHNIEWLTRVLRDSPLLDASLCIIDPADEQVLQLLSRLRSCFGLSLDGDKPDAHLRKLRSASRCYVYNLRNYRFGNNWGPFVDGGEVNWRHIEAVLNVVLMNLSELPDQWSLNRPPIGFHATRPYSAPGCFTRDQKDWAGVEGTWGRYICFLDYHDLFAFNYANINDPRSHSFFDNQVILESTRLVEIKLQIVPLGAMQLRNRVPPEVYLPQDKNPYHSYPPLCFSGFSRGVNTRHAVVEGTVRMGEDGVVRWQFTSIYDGHTQWCSEGVQVANVGSAIGVVGTWTGAHHSPGDPVGPFWMWKIPESHPNDPTNPP